MKNKLKGIFIGIVIGVTLVTTCFATTGFLNKNLFYNNIKILLDNQEVSPTDADGNYVEPFIIDGTTYLPVRAVANALDMDVNWDEKNNTVIMKSPNADTKELTDYARNLPWECDHQVMAVFCLGGPLSNYWESSRDYFIDYYFPEKAEELKRNIQHYIDNSSNWSYSDYYLFIPRYKTTTSIVDLTYDWDTYGDIETSEIATIPNGEPFTLESNRPIKDGGPMFRIYSDGKECMTMSQNQSDDQSSNFRKAQILDLTDWDCQPLYNQW